MEKEIKSSQKEVISWILCESTNEERFEFLRKTIDALPANELDGLLKLVTNGKKRRKRAASGTGSAEGRFVSAPEKSVPVPNPSHKKGWYRKFNRDQVLAIDVEKVEVPIGFKQNGKPAFVQRAASVAVVNSKQETIYFAEIYRKFGSYRTTSHSYSKNGFNERSLQKKSCVQLKTVQEDLQELFKNKLIVGINLQNDFASLELPIADFSVFDLQWHYYREYSTPKGKLKQEPLGLRSLCKKFFGFDPQPRGQVHTPDSDAINTIKIFMEVYTKIKPEPETMYNPFPCNDIEHFNDKSLNQKL